VFTRTSFPADHARTCRALANLYFDVGDFAAAKEAFTSAIASGEDCLQMAYTDMGRRNEIGMGTASYAMLAYCSLKLGHRDEALIELDRGKARLLAEVLAEEQWIEHMCPPDQRHTILTVRNRITELEAEARLDPGTPARRSDRRIADDLRDERQKLKALLASSGIDLQPRAVDLQSLLELIPTDGFLVAPLVTRRGSAAIVVEHGIGTVDERHLVWLDSLTQTDVTSFLVGAPGIAADRTWFGDYANRRREPATWLQMIDWAGEWLWEHVVSEVHARLQAFGARTGASLIVLPQGGLGVLPWHAAWRLENGVRRYAVEDYTITYAPGAYALTTSTEKLDGENRRGSRFLGVCDPRDDLAAAAAEGELVARHFPEDSRTCLASRSATREGVLAHAEGVNYLHFACHGLYDPRNPFASCLQLADSGALTLSDVMSRLRLSRGNLVCLSACETGLTDTQTTPDEFLGLPAAFHQAGAPAVSSTLWAVDDRVTMIFMDRFYHIFRAAQMSYPAALREAQLWLKDVTSDALAEMVGTYRALPDCPETNALARKMFREFALAPAGQEPPFAHPYYWAAFTYSGATQHNYA
jgi:CHAT domain-containing protein